MKCKLYAGAIRILTVIMTGMLIGCATTSTVVPMGQDTYSLTASSIMGIEAAKQNAFQQADAFAVLKGKYIEPLESTSSYDIDFMGKVHHLYGIVFKLVDTAPAAVASEQQVIAMPDDQESGIVIVEDLGRDTAATDARSESDDLYQKLMQLNELKEKGVLTPEEYQSEKEKLLHPQ